MALETSFRKIVLALRTCKTLNQSLLIALALPLDRKRGVNSSPRRTLLKNRQWSASPGRATLDHHS